jgi:hypothetical protein
MSNNHVHSRDDAETHGRGGTGRYGHGTQTDKGLIWATGQCHARSVFDGPRRCQEFRRRKRGHRDALNNL